VLQQDSTTTGWDTTVTVAQVGTDAQQTGVE
jgi:hypothetical protein